MALTVCGLVFCATAARAQKSLPPLTDGTVVSEKAEYRHDGLLRISGHVKLEGISLDLRGPIQMAAGSDFEIRDVNIKVSDQPETANGSSSLRCEGPVKLTITNSSLSVVGSAHPIWWLQGEIDIHDFHTENSEFHLDHARAAFDDFKIFELEISHASNVTGKHLRLVFLSTHTSDDEEISFANIPADRPFSRKIRMGSGANADLEDTSAQLFLVYVHGGSKVNLTQIGRAQLAIAPTCKGTFQLPHGIVGSTEKPILIPAPGSSNCPFQLRLSEVNADTWDIYAGKDADLTFTNSVIDELTADGNAKVTVHNSEVYADWLSFGGDTRLEIDGSTVGAERLAAQRPDLATSQARIGGHSRATFNQVKFDCGVFARENAQVEIRNSAEPPKYIQRAGDAVVKTEPLLTIQETRKD